MKKMLWAIALLAVLAFAGVSPAPSAGSLHHGTLPPDLTQLPAPIVSFGGDTSH